MLGAVRTSAEDKTFEQDFCCGVCNGYSGQEMR